MKFQSLFVDELCQADGQAKLELHPNTACGLYFFRQREAGHYQAIVINSSGSVERKYYAYAVIAFINHGYLYKELCALQVIDAIADNAKRGWTTITSTQEAHAWAAALRMCTDSSLEKLEERSWERLDATTREHRLAAEQYWSLTEVPLVQRQESERVAALAGVCQIPDGEALYVQAIDMILSRARYLVPPEDFSGATPLCSVPYMCRIQLLADHLYWAEKLRQGTNE